MEIDKRKHKDSLNRIRQVLLDSWDPMGVQDSPDSFDEYDTYAMQILSLMLKGAKEPQVMAYLSEVETGLGLDEPAEDDLLPVAKKLLAIRVTP